MVTVGRITLLVYDLDAAKSFYTKGFGFNVLFDGEVAPGLRTVHVGPGGVRDTGIWLLKTDQPELTAQARTLARGEPALVLYTDDLDADLHRLKTLMVEPIQGPDSDEMGSRFVHLLDPSANEIVLVQLPAPLPTTTAPPDAQPEHIPGTIGLIEFPTPDPAHSAAFYKALFGWTASEGPYRTFKAGGLTGAFPDTINGFPPVRAVLEPGDTIVYVLVEDVRAAVTRAEALGAAILLGRTKTSDDHEMALIADPFGAKIALARSGTLDDE